MLRQLELDDMDRAASVHRVSFDQALPTLAGLHTPEVDRWFFRERIFATCELWGYVGDVPSWQVRPDGVMSLLSTNRPGPDQMRRA